MSTVRAVDELYEQLAPEILDDLTVAANGMNERDQQGAVRLLLYILMKRSAPRRARTRERATPAKGRLHG